jgi:hypothetical protein
MQELIQDALKHYCEVLRHYDIREETWPLIIQKNPMDVASEITPDQTQNLALHD